MSCINASETPSVGAGDGGDDYEVFGAVGDKTIDQDLGGREGGRVEGAGGWPEVRWFSVERVW